MSVTCFSLRSGVEEDIPAIAEVHVRSARAALAGIVPDELLEFVDVPFRIRDWSKRFAEANAKSATFVADFDGRIVGICNACPSDDEDATPETGHVRSVFVLPEFAGIGIGSRLMDCALAMLAGAGFSHATLHVVDRNDHARMFYERRGWRTDGFSMTEDVPGGQVTEVRYVIALPTSASGLEERGT